MQDWYTTLSIDCTWKIARLILETNVFVDNDKYDTQVLANIYMLEWEQDLIRHQTSNKEIYGQSDQLLFL